MALRMPTAIIHPMKFLVLALFLALLRPGGGRIGTRDDPFCAALDKEEAGASEGTMTAQAGWNVGAFGFNLDWLAHTVAAACCEGVLSLCCSDPSVALTETRLVESPPPTSLGDLSVFFLFNS